MRGEAGGPDEARVERIFHGACEVDEEERATYLDRECGSDASLRSAVETLLAADRDAESLFATPGAARLPMASASAEAWIAAQLPGFRVERLLGRGGMGLVFAAHQKKPRRAVALKMMHPGLASPTAVRRFQNEPEFLARLNHPGVARVYEVGVIDHSGAGVPYFAMELVEDARTIVSYCDEEKLSTETRVDLFTTVCDAVHHGHEHGVLHRDLKPSNVLVDGSGVARVIDFGVARATDADLTRATLTGEGDVVGTLAYMSPEQCHGDPAGLDATSDVYSLGVLLYEILCGGLPYDVTGLPLASAAAVIRDAPPNRPPARVPNDVESILMKALEKEPRRRYGSALELASDLRRFLRGEPVEARPASWVYQARVLARRHRAAAGALAAVFLTLVAAIAVSTAFALSENRQRVRLQSAQRETRFEAYLANIAAADAALRTQDVSDARRFLERADEEFQHWEWRFMERRLDLSRRTVPLPFGHSVRLAIDPAREIIVSVHGDARRAGAGDDQGMIAVWDLETGVEETRRGPFPGFATSVAVDQHGLVAWGDSRGVITLWNPGEPGNDVELLGHTHHVRDLAFMPDGGLASVSLDGTARLWRVPEGTEVSMMTAERPLTALAILPPGDVVVTGDVSGEVALWEATMGELLRRLEGHDSSVNSIALAPGGSRLATASSDATVRVWDLDGGSPLVLRHELGVNGVAFAPDGIRLASGCTDRSVRIWKLPEGVEIARFRGHAEPVECVTWDPSGRWILSGSKNRKGSIKLWDARSHEDTLVLDHYAALAKCVAFGPDDAWLAVGDLDGKVRVYDAAALGDPKVLEVPRANVNWLDFAPDGSLLAAACGSPADGRVTFWELSTGQRVEEMDGCNVRFSPVSDLVAVATHAEIRWIDAESLVPRSGFSIPRSEHWIVMEFLVDGGLVVLCDGTVLFRRDPRRDEETWRVEFPPGSAGAALALSPDGQLLAVSRDRLVEIREGDTGELLTTLSGHGGEVLGLAFSPDGKRLASVGDDATLRLWHVPGWREVLTLRGPVSWIWSVAFSRDGRRIATGAGNHRGYGAEVRVWDADRAATHR